MKAVFIAVTTIYYRTIACGEDILDCQVFGALHDNLEVWYFHKITFHPNTYSDSMKGYVANIF